MGFDEFDEEAYLRANPDVAVMVTRGLFASPRDHWDRAGSLEHANGRRRSGFFEHDSMYDEETYLRQNPDVARLVRARSLSSGYEHWMRHGRVEFSRGRRHGPFVATSHTFRAFRLLLGDAGVLVVGAAGRDAHAGSLTCRHGDDPPLPVDAVAWTRELSVVDVCERPKRLGLAVVRIAGLSGLDGRRPKPIAVLAEGSVQLLVARDAGLQAFAFQGAADANAFLEAALSVCPASDASRAARESLMDFAFSRLHRPADAKEPFSGVVLETLIRRPGGFAATGWLAPGSADVERVVVWCPDTGEHAELPSLVRVARPDVLGTLRDGSGIAAGTPLGFEASLPLPRASEILPGRLIFGVTLRRGVPRWFECRNLTALLGAAGT